MADLPLCGLPLAAVAELVAETGWPTTALARSVHARSDGNPFLVHELLQTLKARLTEPAPVSSDVLLDVPTPVADVVAARLARLRDSTQRTLAAAAVLGPRIESDLLAEVEERPLEEVLDELETAERAALVRPDVDRVGSWGFVLLRSVPRAAPATSPGEPWRSRRPPSTTNGLWLC